MEDYNQEKLSKNTANWFVYLLQCKRGLYCGITNDLEKRIKMHNAGTGAKAVKALGLPALCVFVELYENKGEALSREYQIKQLTKKQKLELVENFTKQLHAQSIYTTEPFRSFLRTQTN